jgi:hypothetical protein
MSSVVVLTPLIVAGWPVVTAAVTAAMGTMGFAIIPTKAVATSKVVSKNRAEIDVEESEILNDTVNDIVVERQGVRAVFSRDARGGLKLCVEGDHKTKAELKQIGEELMGSVTQQYAYHRIVSELQQRNMTVVAEEVSADRTVKIRVRNG